MSLIGAALVGGALGLMGTKSQNRANARQASNQIAFQREMSNTAVQRRMGDLKAAGINPILAARYDASTPPGAMAQMQNVGLGITQGASTATGIQQTMKQTEMTDKLLSSAEVTSALMDFMQGKTSAVDSIIDRLAPGIDLGAEIQEDIKWALDKVKATVSPIGDKISEAKRLIVEIYHDKFGN